MRKIFDSMLLESGLVMHQQMNLSIFLRNR
jgi:hypothetical protein